MSCFDGCRDVAKEASHCGRNDACKAGSNASDRWRDCDRNTTLVFDFLFPRYFYFCAWALVKRYAERSVSLRGDRSRPAGRGYSTRRFTSNCSLSGSLRDFRLNNPDCQVAFPRPIWLWFVLGLLLYWVSRMWMKAHRGEMHDDPRVFTALDWQSLIVVFLVEVCFLLAARIRQRLARSNPTA